MTTDYNAEIFEDAMKEAINNGMTFNSICRYLMADCKKLEHLEIEQLLSDAVPNAPDQADAA